MGFTQKEIEESLGQAKYDDVFATYLLLGRTSKDVSRRRIQNEKWMKDKVINWNVFLQPESDGSRSGSSLSLRNIPPQLPFTVVSSGGGSGTERAVQSPSHKGVHRSISATNPKPRRASSGGETLRKFKSRGSQCRLQLPSVSLVIVQLVAPGFNVTYTLAINSLNHHSCLCLMWFVTNSEWFFFCLIECSGFRQRMWLYQLLILRRSTQPG